MLAINSSSAGIPTQSARRLSRKLREQIALCADFPEKVLFLDIETTGLSHHYDELTIVGWAFDGRTSTLLRGQDHLALKRDATEAVAVVTFNGIRFDARFLRQEFPDLKLPPIHLDLMYLCRRVGLTGGQKAIERELGLEFRQDIREVDGFAAVLLWHRYLRGDVSALELLIRYNRCDIAAMGAIFDSVLERLGIEPDLYAEAVSFTDWAAPQGWMRLPSGLGPAPTDLRQVHSFSSLFGNTSAERLKVVGIDLTGSEARPSGWALLNGHRVWTELLSTDEQIIERTISAKPHLVSIDSPLCLPAGRLSATDDDPGRDRFGIMRESERELKRRGINVYPCLLPSMQKLTVRGMSLAKTLRELGFPVIESYPGAAQDIMRIPRKGAGEEWLRLGLKEFGVDGPYTEGPVSHDELDAVTSALVGTFHWIGLSEALGSDEEPPLIIPDLSGKAHPIVVGVSGPIAAGKTTLARALERKGFAYTRFSLVIDDELRARGKPLDRPSRQALGMEIHQKGRQRWLAERTLARVSSAQLIVVDGLRFPEDHAFLAEEGGANYLHVHVDATEAVRQERYNSRTTDGDFTSAASAEVEGQVDALRSLGHRVVSNEGSKSDLEQWAENLALQLVEENQCQSLS